MNSQTSTAEPTVAPGGDSPRSCAASGSAMLRHEMMDMMLKYRMLSEHPKAQAEAIAKHYAAYANIALDLLNIVEAKRHAPTGADTTSSDDAIRYLVDEIKQGHAHDLGIQLDWPNEKLTNRPSK